MSSVTCHSANVQRAAVPTARVCQCLRSPPTLTLTTTCTPAHPQRHKAIIPTFFISSPPALPDALGDALLCEQRKGARLLRVGKVGAAAELDGVGIVGLRVGGSQQLLHRLAHGHDAHGVGVDLESRSKLIEWDEKGGEKTVGELLNAGRALMGSG